MSGSRILQTEYTTWMVQDKHAKATDVLANAVSTRIAKALGLPRAETAPTCLACHSLDVPAAQRARTFTSEGVSCEACHGPAAAWLGPHTTRGWTHAQSVGLGMYDTKDVTKRVERCASCHIGTADKAVDHEMIAAGHPDLVFDLAAFSAAMPRHWQGPPSTDRWRDVRDWSVGQIVQLREGLARLARRAAGPVWPEYAELDCFACHHRLTRPDDSWRQERGYANRRPGSAPWNHARFAVARLIVRAADAGAGERFDADMTQLAFEMSKLQGDRTKIAGIAGGVNTLLDGVAARLAARPADAALTVEYMRGIVDEADRIAAFGERSAEQAAMSLEALFSGYRTATGADEDQAVRAALDRLFQQLENPSAYDPRRFAAELKRVGEVVPGRR